jgi:hypothetical protein
MFLLKSRVIRMETNNTFATAVDGLLKTVFVALQKKAAETDKDLNTISPEEMVSLVCCITGITSTPTLLQPKYPSVATTSTGKKAAAATAATAATAAASSNTGTCIYVYQRGDNKGCRCGSKVFENDLCKTHHNAAMKRGGKTAATTTTTTTPGPILTGAGSVGTVVGLGTLTNIPPPTQINQVRPLASIPISSSVGGLILPKAAPVVAAASSGYTPIPLTQSALSRISAPVKSIPAGWLAPDHSGITKSGIIFIIRKDTDYTFGETIPAVIPPEHIFFPVFMEKNGEVVPLTFDETVAALPGTTKDIYEAGIIEDQETWKAHRDFIVERYIEYKKNFPAGPGKMNFTTPLTAGAPVVLSGN